MKREQEWCDHGTKNSAHAWTILKPGHRDETAEEIVEKLEPHWL